MTLTKLQKMKIRVFVKTYLSIKGKASSKELATAVNELDIGLTTGVTSNEMARLLKVSANRQNKNFLNSLTYEKTNKGMVYYLEK